MAQNELLLGLAQAGLTVSAVLSDGTRRYTQRLVYISDMDDSGYSWRTLWEEQG